MNMITALGVYAAISKELGLPLCFPGTEGGYKRIDQAVDTLQLAKASVWAATQPHCDGEIFNVSNGGLFRWEHMWPRIADALGMRTGPIRDVKLVEAMAHKGGLWSRMVAVATRPSACVGTVYAATVVVRAPSPEWRERAPYGLCLVDLDEGVRVMTRAEPGIGIGARVRIGFQRTDQAVLPIAALITSDGDRTWHRRR